MTPTRDERPDPDALLARVQAEERTRARLKVFFGFAPGVGKTFSMLEAARRLQAQGVDVVVGLIEAHGRAETAALVDGLEVLPRRTLHYRGRLLEEFDLERALSRRPTVLLLDELAHTNVAGSRHARRWQDVLELLDAGIEVHTTLNVQHVESLNDVVEQITHVQVRETVPDSILERADEIELVDLPPEELLKRLAEGKVYLPEQARHASEHFFRRGNLLALRELALRRTAERVDADVLAYRQQHEIEATWPSSERIVVCVGPAPASARLVRASRRLAAGLRAPWHAVWVENPVRPLGKLDQERLDSHLKLTAALGGEVVRLSGTGVSQAVLDWARAHNVTRIILGKPTHSRLKDRLRGSLLDEIVRGSGDIDVQVISGDPESPGSRSEAAPAARSPWAFYGLSILAVAFTTGLGVPAHRFLHLPDPEMLYLVTIMAVAAAFGRGPALLASALSVGAYDFFFVPPYLTFAVHDTRFVLTFAVMFGVGVAISALASRLRGQELDAREREQEARALFSLTRALAEGATVDELARVTVRHCAEVMGLGTVVVLLPREGRLEPRASWPTGASLPPHDVGVAEWVLEHDREAGLGTDTLSGAGAFCVPLGAGLGVVAFSGRDVPLEQRSLLQGFTRQAAVAFERLRLAEEARSAALRARTEEMRSALLSTVSHDLRTPLAVVTGAATTLRDDASIDPATRGSLVETICDEAERLERIVRNLLDMTRVQAGALQVKREWVPLEEIIGSARARLARQLGTRPLVVSLPPTMTLVAVDPLLFEQVLLNLLDNALKYTPAGSPIDLLVREVDGGLELEVADRGAGIDPTEGERVFEKFYRGARSGGSGAGLGLAVSRGIVEAHGGRIAAYNRAGGGARFVVSLPVAEAPPQVPPEEAA
jgi:two-component system sensor histidine kinase KdpD